MNNHTAGYVLASSAGIDGAHGAAGCEGRVLPIFSVSKLVFFPPQAAILLIAVLQ